MSLEKFAKHKMNKELLSKINGGGQGSVTCGNGDTLTAAAESLDSVARGGKRFCRDRGGVVSASYQEDAIQ
ncbi:MAG TPA: hypothetical protein DCS93_32290 [Microscillaceae bacterium]|nr:hypothetical protein [Microscillaceae bacterium]